MPSFFLMTILSYCIFFVNTFHLIDAQIQILASIYFRSYNKIFYHNNCYFSSKKAPKHFCPSAIKSHFYTLTSNPFLNMNLITTTNCIISQISKVNLAPNHFEFQVCNFANLNLIIAVSSLIL